ncbi:hypothetical protein [Niveibacterium sp.]|uniref:hypothetical protein n=1 Tax=Niveibacterium sp. TaxID=2017444 RepID=UPI0035AF7B0E
MRQLGFKTPAYRLYAPWLHRLTRLRGWLDSRWHGGGPDEQRELTNIYWDRYLAGRFNEEAPALGGITADTMSTGARRSDRVFILGCGASIARIDDATWQQLALFDSIGVNYFYVHPFRPRYHLIEVGRSAEALAAVHDELLNNPERQHEIVYMQIRHLLNNDFVLNSAPGRPLLHCPPQRTRLYSPTTLPTRDQALLSRLLKRYYLATREPLIHHSSNLDCAINFAVRQGYREICLLGVDLSGNQYFFDLPSDSPAFARAKAAIEADYRACQWDRQPDQIHATANRTITDKLGCLSICNYLQLVDQAVLKPNGIQLAVCNPQSLLVNHISYRALDDALRH